MKNVTTESYQKTSSSLYQINYAVIAKYAFLVILGMLAVTIHAKMRIPLKLPGHHGLEFVALIMFGKIFTDNRWAGRISTIGAGLLIMTPFIGFKDPFMAIVILLPGIGIDLFCNYFPVKKLNLIAIALFGGFSYMLIPIARIIITTFTGYPYESLMTGFLYPVFTHFIFGMSGAIIAFGLAKGVKELRKK
jgi:hypothetical protein